MASVGTHVAAFFFLVPTGVRRVLYSSSVYLKSPSLFRSRPWYFSDPTWKTLDLFFLLIALPICSFSEFSIFLSIPSHPTYGFAFFQQSLSVFLFWALLILIVFRESFDLFLVNESFVFVVAGVAFLVEYSVIGKGISGLGTVMYDRLAELTLLCACSCLVLSVKPNLFFADFFLSCGLVFKGTWLLQAGLNLFTDVFSLKGCHQITTLPDSINATAKCDLDENSLRGETLVNLLFNVHAVVVLIIGLVLFGLLSSFRSLRFAEATGPLLAQSEADSGALARSDVPQFVGGMKQYDSSYLLT